jgi:hypothetical protein
MWKALNNRVYVYVIDRWLWWTSIYINFTLNNMSLAYHMCKVERVDEENTDVLSFEFYYEYIKYLSDASCFQQFKVNSYNSSTAICRQMSLNWYIEKRVS